MPGSRTVTVNYPFTPPVANASFSAASAGVDLSRSRGSVLRGPEHRSSVLRQHWAVQKHIQVLHPRSPSKVANTDFYFLRKRGRYVIPSLTCHRVQAKSHVLMVFAAV